MSRTLITHRRFSEQDRRLGGQCSAWRKFPALALLAVVALAGCSGSTAPQAKTHATPTATATPAKYTYGNYPPQEPNPFAYVTFIASSNYADVQRVVTDLGLQPVDPCVGVNAGANVEWRSAGEAKTYGYSYAGSLPALWVYATGRSLGNYDVSLYYTTPPDWPIRLSQASVVSFVRGTPIHCPAIPVDKTPIPGKLYFIDPAQTPTYLRVTFTGATTYDSALVTISELGFRLADPCYEQAQPKPAWHLMGQEQSFAANHSLVIATTGANSGAWQQQLQQSAGATTLTIPYHPTCPA